MLGKLKGVFQVRVREKPGTRVEGLSRSVPDGDKASNGDGVKTPTTPSPPPATPLTMQEYALSQLEAKHDDKEQ